MNPKEKKLFEGLTIVIVFLVLFVWLTIRAFSAKDPGVTNMPESSPAESLSDPILNQLSQDIVHTDRFYQVPVGEPAAADKDKGTLVP